MEREEGMSAKGNANASLQLHVLTLTDRAWLPPRSPRPLSHPAFPMGQHRLSQDITSEKAK